MLVGGIPKIYYDRFKEIAIKRLRGTEFTGIGLDPIGGKYEINAEYCDELIETAVRYVENRPESVSDGLGVVLLRRPWESRNFEFKFSPFALCVSADVDVLLREQTEGRKRSANEYADIAIDLAQKLERRQREVSRYFTDQLRRTPALLPKQNFKSKHLTDALDKIFNELKKNEPVHEIVDRAMAEFISRHPRNRDGKGFKFEDDAGITFKSPPRTGLHGDNPMSPSDKGHKKECFLTCRVRFGGSYSERFHYDCTRNGKQLIASLFNCHDEFKDYKGDPHLNIFPNGFIRT